MEEEEPKPVLTQKHKSLKKHKKHHAKKMNQFSQEKSVPYCTSAECFTESADPWNFHDQMNPTGANEKFMNDYEKMLDEVTATLPDYPYSGVGSFAQKPSVPFCTSYECKTDTVDPYSAKHEEVGLNPHSLNMTNNGDVVTGYTHFRDEQEKLFGLSQMPVISEMPDLSFDYYNFLKSVGKSR
jgi:hypothetical protein